VRFAVSPERQSELERRMAALGIRESDLEERFIRSSGPGGQNVNKVETGVYLRHVPSRIDVKMTQERSQALNRFLARRRLCDKLDARLKGEQSAEQARAAKLRRQKRRRSRRAQAKVLRLKRERAVLRESRGRPDE
jgi:protein subunit release factor B